MSQSNTEQSYSFTQPICDEDWQTWEPGREPVRIRPREIERCVICGKQTMSGIYVRIDPRVAAFPSRRK